MHRRTVGSVVLEELGGGLVNVDAVQLGGRWW